MLQSAHLRAAGVPYLDQWFGVWCMYEPTFLALYSRLKGIDEPIRDLDEARHANGIAAPRFRVLEFGGSMRLASWGELDRR